MSVEPSEATSETWPRWQGQVINTTFPLGRCLGSSDHSGVFLTKFPARSPPEVAIKLVPTNRALAELLLPRWKRAGGLPHPHLLSLLQWGGCQLEGLPYLYVVMEYADQTLAQLLQHRALTDDEAREMLLPTLDALEFLHDEGLVQGQLKPANILVVGDQLKLASDTIRRVGEGPMSINAPTAYDPPEARQGRNSTAGDIWALGVTLLEALTRRLPSGLGEPGAAVVLPADFSPAFRDIVARCLSPTPEDRPTVRELVAWARGQSEGPPPAATIEITALAPPPGASAPEPSMPEAGTPEASAPEAGAPEAGAPEASVPEASVPEAGAPPSGWLSVLSDLRGRAPSMSLVLKPRPLLVTLGAIAILALVWAGIRIFSTHGTPAPPSMEAPAASLPQAPGAAAPAAPAAAPVSADSAARPGRTEAATSPTAVHEVIPDVPWTARRTVRGHIKVYVRVIVSQDGSVFAAVPDRSGPSRYFQRVALEAAKKWTFSPVDTPSQRLMQVRFDFSREGTSGRAVAIH
jgi:TonB family protein